MAVKPYAHQLGAVRKLGRPDLPSRLIADDMGLGKTLEALLIDGELRSERHQPDPNRRASHPAYMRPTLIIAPKSAHYDAWYRGIRMLEDWDDDTMRRLVAVINPKDRDELLVHLEGKYPYNQKPAFVIIHPEALRLMDELQKIKWFHIIVDEVHRFKNRKAQQTHYLKRLQTYYKTAASGTPADDKPQDLWSILNWLYPKEFSSYWRFVNQYCLQDRQEIGGGRTFRKIVGVNKEAMPRLHQQMGPWYIRRTKDQVLDLPPKTYTELHVDLLPSQRRAYDQMRKDMIAWVGQQQDTPLMAPVVVAQLIRLQQLAMATVDFEQKYTQLMPPVGGGEAHRDLKTRVKLILPSSKVDRLDEVIEGNPGQSLVIFTQSRSMVDLLVAHYRAQDITAMPYHGQISSRDRDRAVDAFQAGYVQLFISTIAAGAESITLHRASNMVFLDRMWNPTKNRQAEDRCHRIGQENPVQIIDIMARDTVDRGRKQRVADKWEQLLWLLGDKTVELLPAGSPQEEAMNDAISIFMEGM